MSSTRTLGMRRGRGILITFGVLVALVGIAVLAWGAIHAKPLVSATVVGYTTNQAPPQTAKDIGSSTYVCAVVAVTNNSKHDFTYKGHGFDGMSPELPVYGVLVETAGPLTHGKKTPEGSE